MAATDVTKIVAGRDILFSSSPDTSFDSGIQLSGPGSLLVQAGGSIDLGTTSGIQSLGNTYNPALSSEGSTVMVVAGFTNDISLTEASKFFDELRKAGTKYSKLQAAGDSAAAQKVINDTKKNVITPLFGSSAKGAGDINMTTSQISSSAGSDIFILANGNLNVGKSTFFANEAQRQGTGIITASGGAINIFAEKNVNVNESRVMTYMGGDITVWERFRKHQCGPGIEDSNKRLASQADLGQWDPGSCVPASGGRKRDPCAHVRS